ncbi:MAG: tRNA pseudouridine(38-40) synthase TruA [Oscillospiraceae bacterium]|nr:tRNA pseudouridine(38-40) synthase TruA [Oscillospiraceae bacterium]
MRNLLITISYKGTAYHGFQVQKNAVTVCEVFQNAVEKVLKKREDVKGCSRTDSGVHAGQFCVGLSTEASIPCENLVRALNVNLPDDVAVLDCIEVPQEFHARYSSTGKRYVYRVWNSAVKNPFLGEYSWHYPYKLDVEKMNRAAADFIGTHDFSAFCSAGTSVEDKVRTIHFVGVEKNGDLVQITVEGDGFLYNMVRIMAGTLIEIGGGFREETQIPAVLASLDRAKAGKTAPAHGLHLDKVFYDEIEGFKRK